MFQKISDNPEVQSRYVALRQSGQSHNMAEMLATRTPTGTRGTDRAFMQGRMHNSGLGDNFIDRRIYERARRAGISTGGKVYMASLGGKLGSANPEAWVSSRDDVIAVCKKRGFGYDNVPAPEAPPRVQCRLAEDIVQETMQERLKENPGLATNLPALRHEIIEKHGQKADTVNYAKPKELKPKRTVRKV